MEEFGIGVDHLFGDPGGVWGMACDFGGATTVGAMSHDVFEGVIGSDGERVGFEEFFGGV